MKVDGYLKAYRELVFKRSVSCPPLKKADFELFFKTGNRLVYEKNYFEVRKALTVTALKVILSESPETAHVEDLAGVIKAILSESDWALPAHCTKDSWDTGNYGIDLFAAETAGSLAEILYLVREKLPGAKEDKAARVHTEWGELCKEA